MAIAEYQPLKDLLSIGIFSVITGTVIMLQMLWRTIVQGPRKYFCIKKRTVRPAVLDDPNLGTHHFARLKAVKLHYVSKGNEDKPLFLCLHGFPEFWYSWRYQLKEFSKDYRVVALDMRGYSESEKPSGIRQYNIDKLTADVKDFVEHLGHKQCVLAGHDWGGAVAWAVAMEYPDLVEKLIVCNIPHPRALKAHLKKSTSQAKKSWYMAFFQMPVVPEVMLGTNDLSFLEDAFRGRSGGAKPGAFTDDDIEAFKYTFQNYGDRNGPINYYRAAGRFQYPIAPRALVQCPTLSVWGTGDAFLEQDMAEMSRKYVDNDYSIKYLEGTSHWVQQEEPEKVNQYIWEFLRGGQAAAEGKEEKKDSTAEGKKALEKKPEEKKPEEKKPEERKPEEKKPEERKPEEKKPEEKKPEERKPEEKKPEERKPEEKKPEERKPAESKQEEKKPEERKPEEKKPEERKPEEKKAEERKPEEKKPDEKQNVH